MLQLPNECAAMTWLSGMRTVWLRDAGKSLMGFPVDGTS